MKKRSAIFIVCLVLAGVLSSLLVDNESSWNGQTQALQAVWTTAGSARVPYEDIGNRIVFAVTINRSEPLRFILDTGAPITCIFTSERTVGFDQSMQADGETLPVYKRKLFYRQSVDFVDGLELEVGNFRVTGLSVAKWKPPILSQSGTDDQPGVDGIIGYDLLRFVALEIDRSLRIITLHEPASLDLSSEWTTGPIELRATKPYCRVQMRFQPENQPISVMAHLDLGNAGGIWCKSGKETGVPSPEGKLQKIGMWATGDPMLGVASLAHEIAFVGQRLNGVVVRVVPGGHYADTGQLANIGESELKAFDLVLDYSRALIALKPTLPQTTMSADELRKFEGIFSSSESNNDFRFHIRGGLLYANAGGRTDFPLTPTSPHQFKFAPMSLQISFSLDDDGTINHNSFAARQGDRTFQFRRKVDLE